MSDWIKSFDAGTTWEELHDLIEIWAQRAVDDVRVQLEADDEIPPVRREAILTRLLPFCRTCTREAFEAAWLQLQADAAGEHVDTTVH